MIKVSVLYPHTDGARFDMRYYEEQHIPLVERLVGGALLAVEIDQGTSALRRVPHRSTWRPCTCTSTPSNRFQQHFGPHGSEIRADIRNYTDIRPVIQIAEVRRAAKR
jgi:uncharacterized protein (TIGR02118 family)